MLKQHKINRSTQPNITPSHDEGKTKRVKTQSYSTGSGKAHRQSPRQLRDNPPWNQEMVSIQYREGSHVPLTQHTALINSKWGQPFYAAENRQQTPPTETLHTRRNRAGQQMGLMNPYLTSREKIYTNRSSNRTNATYMGNKPITAQVGKEIPDRVESHDSLTTLPVPTPTSP